VLEGVLVAGADELAPDRVVDVVAPAAPGLLIAPAPDTPLALLAPEPMVELAAPAAPPPMDEPAPVTVELDEPLGLDMAPEAEPDG
jgi:hypothetical protein